MRFFSLRRRGAGCTKSAHFDDAVSVLRQLPRDLRLEIETHAAQSNALQNFAPENLVRGLHIRQPRAEQEIRQGREKTIRQARAKWNPTLARVQKTRSIDDVRLAIDNRL
jgi:hypothetical protein